MVFQHKRQFSLSPYGHMLTSAKPSFVANNCISFSHVRKLGNIISRNLTKHVRGLLVWMEDIPPNLVFVLFSLRWSWPIFLEWNSKYSFSKKNKKQKTKEEEEEEVQTLTMNY